MRKLLYKILGKLGFLPTVKPVEGKLSYSQCGEDLIIGYLFQLRGITAPSCLDVGAYHPVYANNTYQFHLKGSKVVNIDSNPAAIEMFKKQRNGDVNLNIGIGSDKGEFDFYIMDEESLNTFSVEEKDSLLEMGHKLTQVIKIPVEPINNIMATYFQDGRVDFLSIDAEGVDFEIIKSLNFGKYAPRVICIESINYTKDGTGDKRVDLCNFIENAGYLEYANTNINSIFVHRKWWFGK
jgi:FkbM family methyltransferase